MITFVDYFDEFLCGTNVTLQDCCNNFLKMGIDCDFKMYFKDLYKVMDYLFFFNFKSSLLKPKYKIEDEIVITTLFVLKQNIYNIKCNTLIILDSLDFIQCYHTNILNDIYNEINKISDNVIVLANPFNFQFIKYNTIEYYHKFNFDRIDKLGNNKQIEGLYLQNREHIINPFVFKEYNYKRYFQIGSGFYENICKLIFEYNWLNKLVSYSPENKTCDDGLTYYLKLFNIDDTKKQTIKIDNNELKEKLGFSKNDELLNLVNV